MSAVLVELPEHLRQSLEDLAQRHGVSVQQLLVSAAAEKASALEGDQFLEAEARLGRREDFEAYLRAVPDAPPLPGDEMNQGARHA